MCISPAVLVRTPVIFDEELTMTQYGLVLLTSATCNDLAAEQGCIQRYWGLEVQHVVWGRHN